jgi:hypothetical protein
MQIFIARRLALEQAFWHRIVRCDLRKTALVFSTYVS